MTLINGKILLTKELTFDTVEEFLLQQGYYWIGKGRIRQSDIPSDVNMFFFYNTGVMRYASDYIGHPFWLKHPNPTYTIKDNELVKV